MTGHAAVADSFWRFSLRVYARPGVAELLIGLQDRGGHNINLILLALWLGIGASVRLDAEAFARAKTAMARIDRDVVTPLRQLRRALKDDPDPDVHDLRRRILSLEIAAERRVQARLVASVTPRHGARRGDRNAIAEANLRLILGTDFALEEAALLCRAAHPFAS
jgi:uncharacterized protein (TIGR02444 family)